MYDVHMRVLGRIRLSKDADETGTSVERQRESIEQWSSMHGHEIVGWAVDSGVSGGISPFDTTELGAWLHEHRLPEWDTLVAYRLDRLSRRVIPLNELFGFVLKHGKTLASVSESLDLSTWIGRLVANVIAGVAEGELEAIRERNLGSQKSVRNAGRWHGGTAPYGYTAIRKTDGFYLTPEPEEARVLREVIIPRVLAHESRRSIARHLNETGVPTRKGAEWSAQVIRHILVGRSILGQHIHKGKVVRDEEGLPQQRAEPLLTMAEYDRVQTALSARSIRHSPRNANSLQGVLFCYRCKAPMYHQAYDDRPYAYYRCSRRSDGCTGAGVRSDKAIIEVERALMLEIGERERTEKVYRPGADHTAELAAVREAIDATRAEKDLGLYEGDAQGYYNRLERLIGKRRELEQLPASAAGFEEVGLGETYAQAWERLDEEGRRAMLIDSKIRVSVAQGAGAEFFTHVDVL